MLLDLGRVAKQLEWRVLRCISGLVRTGKSDDDADLDWALLIAARATSDQLESSVHLLWLAQETSEKNIGCVLLRHLLREPQQMHAQFKLVSGRPRCAMSKARSRPARVIVGLAGVHQARNASQNPPFEFFFCDAAKVERQPPCNTNRKNRRRID